MRKQSHEHTSHLGVQGEALMMRKGDCHGREPSERPQRAGRMPRDPRRKGRGQGGASGTRMSTRRTVFGTEETWRRLHTGNQGRPGVRAWHSPCFRSALQRRPRDREPHLERRRRRRVGEPKRERRERQERQSSGQRGLRRTRKRRRRSFCVTRRARRCGRLAD